MPLSRLSMAVIACAAAVLVAACESTPDGPPPPPPPPVDLAWQEVSLTVPPGPPGRLVTGDATRCGDRWYLVGAVASGAAAEPETRPAAWESADGRNWSAMTLQPLTYYGHQAMLYSVGCRDGKIAVLGAKRGGAHGNPRVTNWFLSAPHTLRQVEAAFSLFGGPVAVNVSRIDGGRDGWLISGNRTSGAAVWNSADAVDFALLEGVAPLAGVEGFDTWGSDAVWAGDRWVAVGGVLRKGRIDRDPIAWSSTDGLTWQQQEPPSTPEYEEMQRVVATDAAVVAIGLDGGSFRAWRSVDGSWRPAGRFGTTAGIRPPQALSLTVIGSKLIATTVNNVGFSAWVSEDAGDTWRQLTTPIELFAANDRSMVAAGGGGSTLLLVDDAQVSRVWMAVVTP
ncbi:hypothetical protein F4553_002672 [Allocatelliglobosispora scoriae]|uniref:Exo-alpha-sialidase n=1 Tax=Allocatelliglobosispora scoriae TaxID=643052 RepID=A0A841BQT9_9ACTN|nr:hypothetical protein [Allocatelliglobosispora scoriae]MBB5869293.1 hypothetical protein [Allocatelliglobosispora scoriae]